MMTNRNVMLYAHFIYGVEKYFLVFIMVIISRDLLFNEDEILLKRDKLIKLNRLILIQDPQIYWK